MPSNYFISCFFSFLFFIHSMECLGAPKIWNLQVNNQKFIGRDAYIKRLGDSLKKGSVTVLGMSGIGKSMLVESYVKAHLDEYDMVWMFNASRRLDEQFKEFSDLIKQQIPDSFELEMGNGKDHKKFVKEFLRKTKLKWIIIFDDILKFSDVTDYIPETHSHKNKHIILVSPTAFHHHGQTILVEPFSEGESIHLLKSYLGDKYADEQLLQLSSSLGFHPLGLKHSATYLLNSPISMEDYIQKINSSTQFLRIVEEYAVKNDISSIEKKSLFNSVQLSLKEIKSKNKNSYKLLLFLCFINYKDIDKQIISSWDKIHSNDTDPVLEGLLKTALITPYEGLSKGDKYQIHSFVRRVILSTMEKQDFDSARKIGIEFFYNQLGGSLKESTDAFEKNPSLVDHLAEFFNTMSELTTEHEHEVGVKYLHYLYYFKRWYPEAAKMVQKLQSGINSGSLTNKILVASYHSICGTMKFLETDMGGAINESEKAIRRLEDLDSIEAKKELLLLLSNNIGYYYHFIGDVESAHECLRKSDDIQQHLADISMEFSINALRTDLAIDKGEFQEAESSIISLEDSCEKDSFVNKVAGHYCKTLKAKLLNKQGKKAEARKVAQEAYEHALKTSEGDKYAEIAARAIIQIVNSEENNSAAHKMLDLAKKVIEIYDSTFSQKNKMRRQAEAYVCLGNAYRLSKEQEKAKETYFLALSIYETSLKNMAVDDMSELLFMIFQLEEETLFKEEIYQRHIKVFGFDHFRTQKMLAFLEESSEEKSLS